MLPATVVAAVAVDVVAATVCVVQIDYRYKCQILERKNANARVYKSQSPASASVSPPKLSVIRKIDFKSVEHFSAIVAASARKGRDTYTPLSPRSL